MIAIRSQVSARTPRSGESGSAPAPAGSRSRSSSCNTCACMSNVERGRRLVCDHQGRARRRGLGRSSPAGAGRRRAGAGSGARDPGSARRCFSSSAIRSRTCLPAQALLVQADRLGDLECRCAEPGRASSSPPGRRARCGASGPAACRASVRRPTLIGSSHAGRPQGDLARLLQARRQQLHQRQRGGRLAAARLARRAPAPPRAASDEVDPVDDRVAVDGRRAGRETSSSALIRCSLQPRVDVLLEQVAEHRDREHERS